MWLVDIENIAGIQQGVVEISPGVNVIQASNFQGKSSLLMALRTVTGITTLSDESHPLTESKQEGKVTLSTGSKEYTISLGRDETETVTLSGHPVLSSEQDRICAQLFGFLGENNPIRSAVRSKDNDRLTELLIKPLDVADIDERIEQLQDERQAVDTEIRRLEGSVDAIPELQKEIAEIESELSELTNKEQQLTQQVEEDHAQEELREKITSKESRLDSKQRRLSRINRKISTYTEQIKSKQQELNEIEVPTEEEVSKEQVQEYQDQIDELELQISLLEELYRSNREIIDEGQVHLLSEIDRSITEDRFECWICGSKTTENNVDGRLEQIQQKIDEIKAKKVEVTEEIEEIEKAKQQRERVMRKQQQLEQEIEELEFERREQQQHKDTLQSEIENLKLEIEELKAEYEKEQDEIQQELTRVQRKIGSQERTLTEKQDRLEGLRKQKRELEELQKKRSNIASQLSELRGKKEAKETELKEQFDKAMGEIIERFVPGFDNARLNRKVDTQGNTNQFEIIVARNGRETSLDRLSEGEVELIGIVTALAGYRTFSVNDRIPIIALDGIGQLAAEHIKHLTEYLTTAADVVITTAYPEAGEFSGNIITPDNWKTVTASAVKSSQ